MNKIELTLAEMVNLHAELYGTTKNNGDVVEGILSGKMSLTTRYWLNDLGKKVSVEKETIDKLRNDLITKYGEEKDGQVSLMAFTDAENKEINPKFIEFQNEFATLLDQTKEVDYKKLTLEDIEKIESDVHCPVFFKLIDAE
jgi:hypothetical protein